MPGGGVESAQVWVELRSDDPEALSALAVARASLEAGRELGTLRRMRLLELTGMLPARSALEDLLHRSTRFYHPQKERCSVRIGAGEEPPLARGEHAVLITERGSERRSAAERWWLHETGERIEVREGVVWLLAFTGEVDADAALADLVTLHDRDHGLLCNPHSQDSNIARSRIPLPWMGMAIERPGGTA